MILLWLLKKFYYDKMVSHFSRFGEVNLPF